MGYLLSFARSLHVKSQRNQIQLETMQISRSRASITSRIAAMNKSMEGVDAGDPDVQFLQMTKERLLAWDNILETRLAYLQTREKQLAAEEESLSGALDSQIKNSTPKYQG